MIDVSSFICSTAFNEFRESDSFLSEGAEVLLSLNRVGVAIEDSLLGWASGVTERDF